MKTLNYFLIGLVVTLASCGTSKQNNSKTALENNREQRAELVKEVESKPFKFAREQADEYKKEGYKIFLGGLPMDKQIENATLKATDNDYVVGNAMVTAGTVTAAKSQAMHVAKLEIANQTFSKIAAGIKNSLENSEISTNDAKSLNKFLQASQELIVADLGQVEKEIEIYRELPNGNIRLIMVVSYSSTYALESVRQQMLKKMENETQELHQNLEKILYKELQPKSNTNSNLE